MIVVVEKNRENKKLLVIENVDKTVIPKVAKVLSVINLENKRSWVISNIDIDIAGDLKLICIKKYWRCTSQIQDK